MDTWGLFFMGATLILFFAIMSGHARREMFSQQASAWDVARRETEAYLENIVEFDLSKFRKALAQDTFFQVMGDQLLEFGKLQGTSLIPDESKTKSFKMFDESVRILTEEMYKEYKKGTPEALAMANWDALAISTLNVIAKNYMIEIAIKHGTKPKKHRKGLLVGSILNLFS